MKEKLRTHRDTIYRLAVALENVGKATLAISFGTLLLINLYPDLLNFEGRLIGLGAVVGGIVGAMSIITGAKISNKIDNYYQWRTAQKLSGQPS